MQNIHDAMYMAEKFVENNGTLQKMICSVVDGSVEKTVEINAGKDIEQYAGSHCKEILEFIRVGVREESSKIEKIRKYKQGEKQSEKAVVGCIKKI